MRRGSSAGVVMESGELLLRLAQLERCVQGREALASLDLLVEACGRLTLRDQESLELILCETIPVLEVRTP